MAQNMPFDDPDAPDTPIPNQQAFPDQGNAYGPPERLPGITSGAAPKPWGLREPDRGAQAFGPAQPVSGFSNMISRKRPADYGVDPKGSYDYPNVGTPRDTITEPTWKPFRTRGGMSA